MNRTRNQNDGKKGFCIIGPGRLGTALAILLKKAGWRFVGAIGRNAAGASRVCEAIGGGHATTEPKYVTKKSDLVLITTPDDAIAGVCENVARRKAFSAGSVVAHCSGMLTSSVLAPARTCGAYTGSIHPLQSFADTRQATKILPGSCCCIEGQEPARKILYKVAEDLGMHAMNVATDKKPLYHAGAVMASNFLVALQDIALELERAAGLKEEEARPAMFRLFQGTAENIRNLGTVEALTGPFARGDCETVKMHLEHIRKHCPAAMPAYKALALRALELGVKQGDMAENSAKTIRRLLS